MLTALYYPYNLIRNRGLIKSSLCLWDQVEVLTSVSNVPTSDELGPSYREAIELLVRPRIPTEREKRSAHLAIVELIDSELPDWFHPARVNPHLIHGIHHEKFLQQTWHELKERNLIRPKPRKGYVIEGGPAGRLMPTPRRVAGRMVKNWKTNPRMRNYYQAAAPLGVMLMTILADCCAGTTKRLITDKIDCYTQHDRYLKTIGGGVHGETSDHYDRLVTISLHTLDVSGINIKRLVAMRKKEAGRKGAHIRKMRHSFLEKIDGYIAKLSQEPRSKSDIEEIEREFQQDVEDDIATLQEELKDQAGNVMLSKEFGAAVIALAGTFIEPITGGTVAAGALYKKRVEYKAARNKTLENHPMGWVYSTKRFSWT